MRGKRPVEELWKLIEEFNSESMYQKSLYTQLKCLQLPSDTAQCLQYLLKEREFLIQILCDHQSECKV